MFADSVGLGFSLVPAEDRSEQGADLSSCYSCRTGQGSSVIVSLVVDWYLVVWRGQLEVGAD